MSTDQEVAAENPIEQVRDALDGGRRWRGGSQPRPYGESACIVTTALDVHGLSRACPAALEPVLAVIREQYPERVNSAGLGFAIGSFNDHPDTTWADVDLVLDKAAIKWDEQVR